MPGCPAGGKRCNTCEKSNHFSSVSRCARRQGPRMAHSVKAVFEDEGSENEVYCISDVTALHLISLKLKSENWVHFQPDTDAQCNVMSLHRAQSKRPSGCTCD